MFVRLKTLRAAQQKSMILTDECLTTVTQMERRHDAEVAALLTSEGRVEELQLRRRVRELESNLRSIREAWAHRNRRGA